MHKRLLLPLGSIALALIVAAAASASTATKTTIYQAFKSNGKPAIHVVKTFHGSCNGGSIATDRSDAWRCFAANQVLDPCFSSAKAKGVLLCPAAPWKASGVELKVSGALKLGDKGKASTSRMPWGIETTTGQKCAFASGASTVVDKQRLNYFCTGTDELWGIPSRKTKPWTILTAPEGAHKLSKRVGIKIAWF
jgi:hypothetical protein